MAIFSFTIGANRWFSFTFETGTSPTTLSQPSPLVNYRHGTNGPEDFVAENKRLGLGGQQVAESVEDDVASWKSEIPVSLADYDCIDPVLRKIALQQSSAEEVDLEETPVVDDSTVFAETASDEEPRCYFLEVPVEIRLLIYDHILITQQSVIDHYKIMETVEAINVNWCDAPRVVDIYTNILQTCSTVFKEASPTLYGKNNFIFTQARHIENFQSKTTDPNLEWALDLGKIYPGYKSYGKLALLRQVHIRFSSHGPGGEYNPSWDRTPDRNRQVAWSKWQEFVRYSGVKFPYLDVLTLDFCDWQLTISDKIYVNRFVKKFKTPKGLAKLTVEEMSNRANLEELKAGLLRPGGIFVVLG